MTSSDGRRVLLVDDEQEVRDFVSRLLKEFGYEVRTAGDGAEALRLAETEPPDAVLLDVALPDMSGLEVCRRLRAAHRTRTVPILLVTGLTDLETRLAGFHAGADDYVIKPFEPTELAARLRGRLELAAIRARVAHLEGVLATIRLVSHEFNNPLQAVVGALDLLRQVGDSDCPVSGEEAIEMVYEGTDRLAELSNRLITITEPAIKDSPLGPMLDIDASR